MSISPSERAALAKAAGINDQYLYQCMTGRRDMAPRLALLLEKAGDGKVRRWHVRRDWRLVWPELIADPAAPAVEQEPGHAA